MMPNSAITGLQFKQIITNALGYLYLKAGSDVKRKNAIQTKLQNVQNDLLGLSDYGNLTR